MSITRTKPGLRFKAQTEPSNPIDGMFYLDSTLNRFRFRQNGRWVNLGSGNVEQSLLYSLLSDNGMEEIAFDSFDGETDTLVRSTLNLDLNDAEGRYEPNAGSYYSVNWDGSRLPSSGETGTTWSLSTTGTVPTAPSVSGGILTLPDNTTGGRQSYTYNFGSSYAFGSQVVDFRMRLNTETTSVAFGADSHWGLKVALRDGAHDPRIVFVRQGGDSGTRQIVVASGSTTTLLNNLDTGTTFRVDVNWSIFHDYKVVKFGDIWSLYIDNQYVGRFDKTDAAAEASTFIFFGYLDVNGAVASSEWQYFNIKGFNNSLDTKVLINRGTLAFEGDGNPTSATSASTIQDLSSFDFLTEDLWQQWAVTDNGTPTVTALNAGTLQAARRIAVTSANGRIHSITETQRPGLNAILNSDASVSLQAEVTFSNINLTGTNGAVRTSILRIRGANKDVRLAFINGADADAPRLGMIFYNGSTFVSIANENVGNGEQYQLATGERINVELRRVGRKYQFLVNGKVQEEANIEDLGSNQSAGANLSWGCAALGSAAQTVNLDFHYVRATLNEDYQFLPKSPVQEYISALDLSAREAYVSYSSDGLRWTAPERVNASGVAELVLQPKELSSGYPMAKILISSESTARIDNLAVLFNTSFGAAGLPGKFVKTFDSSEIPSEPSDIILSHGMGTASDEIQVFGGTEFLVEELDWEFVDSDNILIKNAVTGVPYSVVRTGFSFDRSQDNSDKIRELQNRHILIVGSSTSGISNNITTDVIDGELDNLPAGRYIVQIEGQFRQTGDTASTYAGGLYGLTDLADNILLGFGNRGSMSQVPTTGTVRAGIYTRTEILEWPGGPVKLRGNIQVTGGTNIDRIMDRVTAKFTKIGEF
jgi:hypothetical protein